VYGAALFSLFQIIYLLYVFCPLAQFFWWFSQFLSAQPQHSDCGACCHLLDYLEAQKQSLFSEQTNKKTLLH
jgi:uncharacterized membrane protein